MTTDSSCVALTTREDILGIAALESLARLASASSATTTHTALSPIQAIQTLAEEGYIESEAADWPRNTAMLRNAVVHGDLSVIVPPDKVADTLRQLRAIAADMMSVVSDETARN
jgi:uncharacterized protein YutE (UPF0331/DUF86 family)